MVGIERVGLKTQLTEFTIQLFEKINKKRKKAKMSLINPNRVVMKNAIEYLKELHLCEIWPHACEGIAKKFLIEIAERHYVF